MGLGTVRVDLEANQILVRGVPVRLTPMEKGVLQELLRHRGKVRTHGEILAAVWGRGFTSEHAYVRTIVQRLRAKLEDHPGSPNWIATIPGLGHLFQDSPAHTPGPAQPPR